jgi:hypothetical protein
MQKKNDKEKNITIIEYNIGCGFKKKNSEKKQKKSQ